MSTDRIEFINPPGDDAARLHDFQRTLIAGIASMVALPIEAFQRVEMSAAEATAKLEQFRDRYSDIAELWGDVRIPHLYPGDEIRFFPSFSDLKWRLRMCRKDTPKRTWRRWRGRVRAGKFAPVPEIVIDFDKPSKRKLAPFVNTDIYRKD